jgi:BRCT domain type II-containing protein
MFESTGVMRAATSKSSLKQQLQVQVSSRISTIGIVNFVFEDSALLWVVPRPAAGTFIDYTDNMKQILAKKLILRGVHLVFIGIMNTVQRVRSEVLGLTEQVESTNCYCPTNYHLKRQY